MKKVFSIWSWAMLLALCAGLSACSGGDNNGDYGKNGVYNVTYDVSVASPCQIGGVEYFESAGTNLGGNKSTTESVGSSKYSKSVQISASSASSLSGGAAHIAGNVLTWQAGAGFISNPKLSVKIYVNDSLRVQSSTYRRTSDMEVTFDVSYIMTDKDKPK